SGSAMPTPSSRAGSWRRSARPALSCRRKRPSEAGASRRRHGDTGTRMTTGRAEGTAAGAGRMRPFAAGRFRPLSLRSKLLLFLAALAFCGTVVLAFAAWEYGRRAADEAYDRLITGS